MDHGEDDEGEQTKKWSCQRCGHIGLDESDGFYYCQECGAQADDIILTGVADEDFVDRDGDGGGALYSARHTRHTQSVRASQPDQSSQAWLRFTQEEEANKSGNNDVSIKREEMVHYYDPYFDGVGPTEPEDFGASAVGNLSYEDFYNEVRIRYVMGMQWMIQLQCEALVKKFNVTPLICGISGTVWLRFLAKTGLFKDSWADDVLLESEIQTPGEPEDDRPRPRHPNEPHNAHGQRAVMIWFRCLRKKIPLSCSLAICFLACHVAREAVLPTDIVKWSIEGKLPYFSAHVDIEKRFDRSSPACPIKSSVMFRPSQSVPVQKLESMAATVAETIGMHLPPVNFYEIACRFLKELSIPVKKILPRACRIYEWCMPPELWLSTNQWKLPTRAGVMSILIVAIRILYNINGFGAWERSLSGHNISPSAVHADKLDSIFSSELRDHAEEDSGSDHRVDDTYVKSVKNASHSQMSELDTAGLLQKLNAMYEEIDDAYDYTRDLPSYLRYCKDVAFAGTGPSHIDNREEEELIEKLWDFYLNEKDSEPMEEFGVQNSIDFTQKRWRIDDERAKNVPERKKIREDFHDDISSASGYHSDSPQNSLSGNKFCQGSIGEQNSENNGEVPVETLKDEAILRLKLDMEEKRFCYIPPRVNIKRLDYLHYMRKRDEGALTYVAHADYYILLRSCAKVAQVDIRIMHIAVLIFERRLAWLEKRIERCLHLTPSSITCQFCVDVPDGPDHSDDDPVGLSQLNL